MRCTGPCSLAHQSLQADRYTYDDTARHCCGRVDGGRTRHADRVHCAVLLISVHLSLRAKGRPVPSRWIIIVFLYKKIKLSSLLRKQRARIDRNSPKDK